MTPEFKTKWIEALRSGKYQQGRSRLRDPNACFCCLGVACDLLDNGAWATEENFNYGDIGYDWKKLPTGDVGAELEAELGLPMGAARTLADLNDNHDSSFSQIADYIEANL